MIKKLMLLAGVLVIAAASPAAAGGWAASTLDEPPAALVAGQDHQVGFMILQHGKTPVNPDQGQVGIRLFDPSSGESLTFPAVQQGPVGHFVSTVNVPTVGAWQWEVLQGWFEPQPLGPIDVVASASAAPAAAGGATTAADSVRHGRRRLEDRRGGDRRPAPRGLLHRAPARTAQGPQVGRGRPSVIDRSVRLAVTGLLGVGLALTAAFWPEAEAAPPPLRAQHRLRRRRTEHRCSSPRAARRVTAALTVEGRLQIGPDLAALPTNAGRRVAGLDAEAYVRQSIREPQAFQVAGFTTVEMPTLAVSDAELDALVHYLLG